MARWAFARVVNLANLRILRRLFSTFARGLPVWLLLMRLVVGIALVIH